MTTTTKKDRRGAILRASIAAVAVLGIGGAITTAAWTDQVTFAGNVKTATFDLRGNVGDGWQQGPIDLGKLFDNLKPGTYTKSIGLKNFSSIDLHLEATTLNVDPALKGAITHSVGDMPSYLPPQGYVSVPVTFTVTDDLPQNTAGTVELTFPASSAR